MRYAVNLPNFADYADVRKVAALAAEAEAAGWDGFFVWDHMVYDKTQRLPVADPWILLAAVALATERLRLTPGTDPEAALAVVEPLAEAGMTWWTESLEPHRDGLEAMRARVRQGPPRR